MSKSVPRLGKGLSALIAPRPSGPFRHRAATLPTPTPDAAITDRPDATTLRQVPLDQIRPNPKQPRAGLDQTALQQLAASVRRSGILQPLLLRTTPDGKFELVAGERRWRAAELAGLQTIPAIVRELSDAQSFEMALVENLQREDLTPLERATAYQQLVDSLNVTIDVVATRLGESRANISNYLRLLKLSADVQHFICSGELGMGQARAIAGIANPQRQLALARLAVRRNLSVRQVERLAKEAATESPTPAPQTARSREAHLTAVEEALSKALGLTVTLQPGKKKNSGRLIIRYNCLEEFDRIAERIGGGAFLE
ncbi:MAG: ParB/RepB/Spo0J family partition protein [Phycisphaerae bacterium]